jgi:hypothetical protein
MMTILRLAMAVTVVALNNWIKGSDGLQWHNLPTLFINIGCLINDVVSAAVDIHGPPKWKDESERWVNKDLEGRGHGLFKGNAQEFAWKQIYLTSKEHGTDMYRIYHPFQRFISRAVDF